MGSAVEQVLVKVKALLLGATDAGLRVERGRADPFAREELPGINIRRGAHQQQPHARGIDHIRITFDLDLECRGADWETQCDALHTQADVLLMSDAELAQMVSGLHCTGTEPDSDGGDDVAGRISAHYSCQLLQRRV